MAAEVRRRLALAAPVMQLLIGTTLLAFAARPSEWMVPAAAAALLLPAAVGAWVFAGRPALSHVLLALWAPAGGVVCFLLVVLAMRISATPTTFELGAIALGPLVVLAVIGASMLRGQTRRTWIAAGVLWLLAIAEVVAAVPLSERFGTSGGMEALAGAAMLLFAPAVAFGSWGGLALAALIPEPADATAVEPAEQVNE